MAGEVDAASATLLEAATVIARDATTAATIRIAREEGSAVRARAASSPVLIVDLPVVQSLGGPVAA